MIISTCGYGSTGASAVLDFLRGYEQSQLINFEFQLIHQADGLADLKYHLVTSRERIACNAAIKRFMRLKRQNAALGMKRRGVDFDGITDRYLDKIIQVSWKGKSVYDPDDLTNINRRPFIYKIQRGINYAVRQINLRWHYPLFQQRYFSLMDEETFDRITKEYIQELFLALGYDLKKDIIMDMLFSATNPSEGMEFFDEAKAILVMRDPRDLYLQVQQKLWTNGFLPWDSVEKFVVYYRSLVEHSKLNDKILVVQYEDLIYCYQETSQKIMDYLGYTNRPDSEFKYFDPDISVKYTNRAYKGSKYEQDINYITKNLGEYLYSFPIYQPRKK